MIIFHGIAALQKYLGQQREKGQTIGFVPTMGALHEGHLSLIRRSKAGAGITACSIFVNPTQFNDPSDFEKYPVTTAADIHLLEREGTDVLFLPPVEEMYPAGLRQQRHYDLGALENILEGAYRPGHFQGVCQVVHRLLDIVAPDTLFLGQKDYQQCMVLKKLVETLAMPTQIVIGETVREPGGLAMSSRNLRLSADQRRQATAIYSVLSAIHQQLHHMPVGKICNDAAAELLRSGFEKVDYVAIADAGTLELLPDEAHWDGSTPAVALAAAFLGGVRLIDNTLLT